MAPDEAPAPNGSSCNGLNLSTLMGIIGLGMVGFHFGAQHGYGFGILGIVAGMPVALAAPSVYTLYDTRLSLANTLVMGISQSGQGTDVVQVLSSARAAGALTACITNDPESPITRVSDHVLLCHAGEERAVAATKTFTTALAIVALFVATLCDRRDLLRELDDLPARMRETL